ncbi:MAG: S41 family peptidase [Patescibacteria group bacterium]
MQPLTRKIFILTVLLSLGAGFISGYSYTRYQEGNTLKTSLRELINKESGQPDNVDFSLFWDVWDTLQAKYVNNDTIETQKLIYGAISGMVNSVGDPYTVFFEPSTSKKFQEEISGAFSGVGMEIGKRNNLLTVISPIKDSPAFRAGIKAGDRILEINTRVTTDMTVEEAVNLIRGNKGTKVKMMLSPSNSNETREVEIIRDTIKIPAVQWTLRDGNVAHIEIFVFNSNVDGEFKKAVQEIIKSKANRIVLDLRNNPGGLLDSAVNLAGYFLDKGSVVTIENFGDGTKNEFKASGNAELKNYPTVVLINGGSASASEILAGALHDNRSIKLIGETSFGKGSVQELAKYVDGSSLKVTIAKWLTPSGISISEKGINADIEIKFDPKEVESGAIIQGEQGKDPQLDKALKVVKQ